VPPRPSRRPARLRRPRIHNAWSGDWERRALAPDKRRPKQRHVLHVDDAHRTIVRPVNRQAFALQHLWVQNHHDPASPAGRCSKQTILGLETKVEQHEGLPQFWTGSHAQRFRSKLQGYYLGPTIEALRDPTGPMTPGTVLSAIRAAHADAEAHSLALDNPPQGFGLNCTVRWWHDLVPRRVRKSGCCSLDGDSI
jgi:hypothetical protein